MITDVTTQAQLYLADQRGYSQTDHFRRYHIFSFGAYVDENKGSFGPLHALNDDTLKAGHRVQMQVTENTDVLLLPIVGGLEYKSSLGSGFLEAGQVQIFSLTKGMRYEIINPYETEFINFIQIRLRNSAGEFSPKIDQTPFDLTQSNRLLPVFAVNNNEPNSSFCSRGFIGKYDGRKNGVYPMKKSVAGLQDMGIFVYILSGVFEVQNRLLHERDGLSLMTIQAPEIEFEALSSEAILLLLEFPLKK